jgi:hypothetical protein
MLDDLDDFIVRNRDQQEHTRVRGILVDGLVDLARSWAKTRNKLFADDRLPTWVARRELEQHPHYGKWYDGLKAKKNGYVRKIFRKIKRALRL